MVKLRIFHFFFLPILAGLLWPSLDGFRREELSKEKYTYEAVPERGERTKKEIIEMDFFHSSEQTQISQKIIRPDGQEFIRIAVLPDGTFLSANKYFLDRQGKTIKTMRMERKEGIVSVEVHSEEKKELKNIEVPGDKMLAVDASLLILMRNFPFDQRGKWDVFMVDFLQQSVSIEVRQAGAEKIVVPLGEFECYRMDVVVKVFIFRPKITFWISKAPPHFLIKHEGKRGPFTPTYTTSLIGRGKILPPS